MNLVLSERQRQFYLLLGIAGVAVANIIAGEVAHPYAFLVTALGFVLFIIAKVLVIRTKALVGFVQSS